MAIFGKLKKAFGFSEADIEAEYSDDLPSASVTPLKKRNELSDEPVTNQIYDSNSNDTTIEDEISGQPMPDEIFESVVNFFNESLPSFLRDNLDTEKQRRYIYDALGDSLKQYLNNVAVSVQQAVERRFANDQANLKREMEAIKNRSRQIEEQATELKELKLSAERQKRALSERVHDLESRIASFDAEREQYELENKSLVNKLRSASVQENDLQALSEVNNELRAQIQELKSGIIPQSSQEETEDLKQQLQQAQDSATQLGSINEELKADKKQLLDDIDLLKKKCEIADAMINDLNKRASSAQKALTEKEAEITSLNQSISELQQAQLSDNDNTAQISTDETVEQLTQQLEKANAELEQSRQAISMFEETLTKFEGLKESKNQAINQLKEQLQNAEKSISEISLQKNSMVNEVESLKSTIENNLRIQAASEAALRKEIDRLKSENNINRSRRGRRPKETVIDETLDNTDWLISSPPEGESARPTIVSDDEFGYREPKRKDPPADDSSQMLLW